MARTSATTHRGLGRGAALGALAVVLAVMVLLCMPEPASGEELWTRWGDRALTTCLKLIKGRTGRAKLEVVCDNYQEVVDEEMKMMAINAGAALGNKEAEDNVKFTNELAVRLERAPYRADGDQILADSARHFIKEGITSPKKMKQYFFTQFAQWLMNAAVDNGKSLKSMPVYPNMDDLEKRMHKDDL